MEIDEDLMESLKEAHAVATGTDVWTSESGEGLASFTASFVGKDRKLHYDTLGCTLPATRHTSKDLYEMFINVIRIFKVVCIYFTTSDGAHGAKWK